ncbi:27 kDa glycoprotein, partial [bacterium LRH843]|nr:27 kDa glycoprotein [bacterium LRH843]
AKEELQFCMKDMLDYKKINAEIETAKPTGDLDKVFRKYCRSTPKLKGCINNFTTSIEPCLEESEKVSKHIIMNITTALEQFICYKEGDRIALF